MALLAIGVVLPALRWSTLPSRKLGPWLIVAIVWAAIGVVIMVPEMLKLRAWAPEEWTGPDRPGFGPWGLLVVPLSWLRSMFGPAAAGLFMLGLGVGVSVSATVPSTHSHAWRLSLVGVGASILAALFVASLGGAVVRHFGRFVDRDGRYVPRRRALSTGASQT